LLRSILAFGGLVLLTLSLPIIAIPVWMWGTAENLFFLKLGFVLFGGCGAGLWYGLISGKHFRHSVQILTIVAFYGGVVWALANHLIF